jgi:polar amino acid transport system substrate-binding protein
VLAQIADLSVMRAQDKGLELLFDVAPDVPNACRAIRCAWARC